MKHQALRPLALMLSVLLIAAVPAQAGTIQFGDVIALATVNGQSGRPTVDLRLRSVGQSGRSGSPESQSPSANNTQERGNAQAQTPSSATFTGGDTSLTGTAVVAQERGSVQVETIELGDISGTICDCGEIFIPKGGFPKLPLLALAGIPLFFLGGGDNDIPPGDFVLIPPSPTTPQIPEPATLFLLGTGLAALGAGARRRRAAARDAGRRAENLGVREA